MNMMGTVLPPSPQTKEIFEGEEFIMVCKGLNISINAIAQTSRLQQNLIAQGNPPESIPNTGRIILFTPATLRNLDHIQEFLKKAIDECNRTIMNVNESDKS